MYICMHVCMYICMYLCMYVWMYLSIYLSIYLSMYLCGSTGVENGGNCDDRERGGEHVMHCTHHGVYSLRDFKRSLRGSWRASGTHFDLDCHANM